MSIEEQKTTPPKAGTTQEELWRAIFKETKEALRKNEGIKKGIIRRCCTLLEDKGMPVEMICGKVTRELADFASRKYLFEVIEQKYKDQQKIRAYNHKQPGQSLEQNANQESVHLRESNEQKIQPEQKEEQEDRIIWQINVSDYKIKDVESYDKAFLIKLVIFLHNRVETLEAAQQQKGV